MTPVDLALALVSFILTLLVLSYILAGDNPFFRIATYLFIGVAAAYVVLVVFEQVIVPQFALPLVTGLRNGTPLSVNERVLLLGPLLLGLLLFTKLSPTLSRLGNFSMAYLVGVGAAVTVGGAVLGTLFSQSLATINLFDSANLAQGGVFQIANLVDAFFVLIGVVATLFFFYFGAKPRSSQAPPGQPPQRNRIVAGAAWLGQIFIAIAFGSLFAGVYIAALSALVERISFLLNFTL